MVAEKASQEFIPIKEIRDGIVVLKDGGMRAIIMTSSINFALKSVDEQQAIIFQFQNFLNSLNFSVQICVQSRRLDIRPYTSSLEARMNEQNSELMRIQIHEYVEFINAFTRNTNIMTKTFFVVVPYTPMQLDMTKSGGFGFFGKKKSKEKEDSSFEESRLQLEQRVGVVQQGIIRSGVRAVQLGTEEVIEVLYKLFNPGDVEMPIPTQEIIG